MKRLFQSPVRSALFGVGLGLIIFSTFALVAGGAYRPMVVYLEIAFGGLAVFVAWVSR